MDKAVLTNSDIEFLLKWRDENVDLVRRAPAPVKAIEIVCKESGYTIKGIREDNMIRLHLNRGGVSKGSAVFKVLGNGMLALVPEKNKMQVDSKDDLQSVITVYASLMALMTYHRASNPQLEARLRKSASYSNKTSSKRKPSERVTYILKSSQNSLYVVPIGSHASPKGIFTVRGHFRHYKNGNVIWIDEFIKGTGEKKSKVYKVGVMKNVGNKKST